ncbi:class I SAM-dependent methyltransferase [Patescibacteria group bacterium]
MYNRKSRENKARQMVNILEDYFGNRSLKTLNLLDVGSSTGIIDNYLSNKFSHVTGIDIDKNAIKYASDNFKKGNLKFMLGDVMKLSFADNFFDVVVCTQIYEHIPNPKIMFDEIYRVLKPGGVCFLAAINKLWPWEPHYKLLFLSWLPKNLAHFYVRVSKRGNEYYEKLETYRSLEKLTQKFKKTDYTQKILNDPLKFGYKNEVLVATKPIVRPFSPILKYLTPTFFWLLTKEV